MSKNESDVRASRALWLLGLAPLVACGADRSSDGTPQSVANTEAGIPSAGSQSRTARAAYIASVQKEASLDYDVHVTRRGLSGTNPAQALGFRFESSGVEVAPSEPEATFSLTVSGYGCPGNQHSVQSSEPVLRGRRVEYSRGALSEWYVNGPLGLEQGFTIAEPPKCLGQLAIGIRVAGDVQTSRLATGDVAFTHESRPIAKYTDLYAYDASGRELPARVELDGDTMRILVDTRGATYPVSIDPLIATQGPKLFSTDIAALDNLGTAVALSGDIAVIGAPMADAKGSNSGAAYVFARVGGQWGQEAKLVASDGSSEDRFGSSAGISADTIVIGAPYRTETASSSGAAYIFVRSAGSWNQQAKLASQDSSWNDNFGASVAIAGDTVVVGSPKDSSADSGAAFVYTRAGAEWTLQTKLIAPTPGPSDHFGSSVAIDGDFALVGAPDRDGIGTNSGGAYLYSRTAGIWSQEALIVPADNKLSDQFGMAVSMGPGLALIGAPGCGDKAIGAGAAYLFTRKDANWVQEAKIFGTDPVGSDAFGIATALDGTSAVVGGRRYEKTGVAYIFTRNNGAWPGTKLPVAEPANVDLLGASVSISGRTALIGVPYRDEAGANAGAAYVYDLAKSTGDSCVADSECPSGFCVDGVCCASACDGFCVACSAALKANGIDGTCGPAKAGVDPRDQCGIEPTSSCGKTGLCDGAGACAVRVAGVECESATCASSTALNLPKQCDGNGTCKPTSVEWCQTGYACVSGACKTSCATSADCAAGYTCSQAQSCIPGLGNGASCSSGGECQSGSCVDHLCCNTACGNGNPSDCQACSIAAGGIVDGMCSATTGNECSDNDACTQTDKCQAGVCKSTLPTACPVPDQCHQPGVCDPSSGICSNPAKTDDSDCSDNNACTLEDKCVGGACKPGLPVVCPQPDECHHSGVCDPTNGKCVSLAKQDGAPCSAGACLAGNCIVPEAGAGGSAGASGSSGLEAGLGGAAGAEDGGAETGAGGSGAGGQQTAGSGGVAGTGDSGPGDDAGEAGASAGAGGGGVGGAAGSGGAAGAAVDAGSGGAAGAGGAAGSAGQSGSVGGSAGSSGSGGGTGAGGTGSDSGATGGAGGAGKDAGHGGAAGPVPEAGADGADTGKSGTGGTGEAGATGSMAMSDDSGGCGCKAAGHDGNAASLGAVLTALAALFSRRKRS